MRDHNKSLYDNNEKTNYYFKQKPVDKKPYIANDRNDERNNNEITCVRSFQ